METLGGYRLIRKLGFGARADIWLGHDGHNTAAIKVFRPTTTRASIDQEIEALGRASHRHLLSLIDLSSTPDGTPCLVLERLSVLSVARILENRALDAGEAVTVLAPIALAVSELHRVGVAHSSIRPGSLLFDSAGAPVLACFGSARLVGAFPDPPDASSLTIAQQSESSAMAFDLERLVELTKLILERIDDSRAIGKWLDAVAPENPSLPWPDHFAEELAERLFTLETPRPVNTTAVLAPGSGEPVPSRVVPSGPASTTLGGILALPAGIEAQFAGWWKSLTRSSLRARVARTLGNVRPRVWIPAGVVALLVVLAGAFLPGITATKQSPSTPTPSSTSPPSRSGTPSGGATVVSDDPVGAASALLKLRYTCYRQLSVLCLDNVNQANSAAMDADSHAIRLAQQGVVTSDPIDFESATVHLVELLGDTALLSLEPVATVPEMPAASLLLVKSEAGWRIRDLVAMDSAASS